MMLASPWWLFLAFLAIPIALLHRRRRRTLHVSSIFLWRRLPSDGQARAMSRWPMANTSLLLQLLVLFLVTLALARPQLAGDARPDHWIVVIDTSGSMEAVDDGVSRLDEAKAHLRRAFADWHPESGPDRITIVEAGTIPTSPAVRVASRGGVLSALERVEGTHGPAQWHDAASLVNASLVADESVHVTVHTDDPDSLGALEAVVPDQDVIVYGTNLANMAIAEARVERVDARAWSVRGELRRFGNASATTSVEIRFHPAGMDSALSWALVPVDFEGRDIASFEADVRLPGPGTVSLILPDDSLAFDSQVNLVFLDGPKTVRVLHVGRPDESLRRAFEALENVDFMRAEAEPDSYADIDLVVSNAPSASRAPDTSVWWLDTLPPERESGAVPRTRDPEPTGWVKHHPLADSVDWTRFRVSQASEFPVLPGATVLVESGGLPLVQARTLATGREIVTAFRLEDTDWAEQVSFPAFVSNLVQWVEPDTGRFVVRTCTVGQECRIAPSELGSTPQLTDSRGRSVSLAFSIGGEGARQPTTIDTQFVPTRTGIYTLAHADGTTHVAVNAFDSTESDVAVPATPGRFGASTSLPDSALTLWPWLLAAALAAVLGEAVRAGLGAEHFLRSRALVGRGVLQRRRRLIVALLASTLALLVLAIFDVPIPAPSIKTQTVFVVDDPSRYDDGQASKIDQLVESVRDGTGRIHHTGIVGMTGPTVLSDLGRPVPRRLFQGSDDAFRGGDLGHALTTATGMIADGEGPGRVVLVGRGRPVDASTYSATSTLLERGIPLDIVSIEQVPEGEVLVERVLAPRRLDANQSFQLEAIIYSERDVDATARILRDGELIVEREARLLAGRNRVSARLAGRSPGSYRYAVEVEAQGDVFSENNRDVVSLTVDHGPRIAIYAPERERGERLAEALEVHGLSASVLAPDDIPHYLTRQRPGIRSWLDYDVVFFVNLPAIELRFAQQELLQRWIREHGGGLIVLGGQNSFGPGGYYETVLEEVLPLSTEIPQEKPSVAIAFVLDRSGSMQQAAGDVSRLDVARDATLNAIELLEEESIVSVIAFDSTAESITDRQLAGELDQITRQMDSLRAGGGTSLYPGLAMAFEHLAQVDAELTRHIVVMTDGLSQPGDFEALARRLAESGISLSTAAIGTGAGVGLLEDLARWGGGAAHATEDFQALPSILAQEALLLTDDPVKLQSFVPTWIDREASFLEGMPDRLPPFHGFVSTSEKVGAAIHLIGPDDMPLLASWRYGLGRVIAFATHGVGPWARTWMDAPTYPRIWAQAVRWSLPATAGPGLHVDVVRMGDEFELTVSALDQAANPSEGLRLSATVTSGTERRTAELREVGPGSHRGRLPVVSSGQHDIVVRTAGDAVGEEGEFEPARVTVDVGYSSLFAFSSLDNMDPAALASGRNGRVLDDLRRAFAPTRQLRWVTRSAWPLWTLGALTTFVTVLLLRYAPGFSRRRPAP